MIEQKIKIKNAMGLHIRPAGVLAKVASQCDSSVTIIFKDKQINCKSVLNIMSAAIKNNDEILVVCEGNNEVEDLKVIIDAIQSGLGEQI